MCGFLVLRSFFLRGEVECGGVGGEVVGVVFFKFFWIVVVWGV